MRSQAMSQLLGSAAALGEDVARRVPGQHAIVFPLDRLATYTVVDHRHLVAEVRYGLALCCRSLQAVVGIDVEEQGGSKQVGGIGGGRRGASSQRHCQQQAAKHSRAVRHGDVSFQRATAGGGPPDRSKATPRRHLAAQQWSRHTAARLAARRRRCSELVAHAEHVAWPGLGGVAQHVGMARVRAHGLVGEVDRLQAQGQLFAHRVADVQVELAVGSGVVRIGTLAADAVEELVAPVVRRTDLPGVLVIESDNVGRVAQADHRVLVTQAQVVEGQPRLHLGVVGRDAEAGLAEQVLYRHFPAIEMVRVLVGGHGDVEAGDRISR
ncbi:hypothetical protein G6F57_016250 [Rhizopus arrhizus]|nr:hypothetical protein G6F57_016250 [Rhizopus arrhizus]